MFTLFCHISIRGRSTFKDLGSWPMERSYRRGGVSLEARSLQLSHTQTSLPLFPSYKGTFHYCGCWCLCGQKVGCVSVVFYLQEEETLQRCFSDTHRTFIDFVFALMREMTNSESNIRHEINLRNI